MHYKEAKARLIAKFHLMDEQIKFLEYVWSCLHEEEQEFYINNYKGHVPTKYS